MLKIGIFSEDTQKSIILKTIIKQSMESKKIKNAINVCNSFTNAVDKDFNILVTSDICIIDFSNHTDAVKLTTKIIQHRNDFTWLCTGANLQTLMELMLLKPSGYIREPDNAEAVNRLLHRVLQFLIHKEKKQYFLFKFENDYIRIPYSDISYFESRAKKVALHLYNSPKVYYITTKLNDIQADVPNFFMRCHQSFLVNMKHIRYFDRENKKIIVLPNEDILISRRKYTESKNFYEEFKKQNL